MKITVIGGRGHVGTYLIPRLAEAGHEVTNVSRGINDPYIPHAAWKYVRQVNADRIECEAKGTFGKMISNLSPDIVIDMICYYPESAKQMVEALKGVVRHYLCCGTIWIHGHGTEIPVTEEQSRDPFGDYGINKAKIEDYLLYESRANGFPATMLHPGHIVGPGHMPVNPVANRNIETFIKLYRGEELCIPNFGLETIHHVHADDVAQGFMKAMDNWSSSVGEGFHLVSPAALNLRGYAEAVFSWFGHEPKLKFVPWDEWKLTASEEDARMTYDHIIHSPCLSIEKAKRLIGYQPSYTSLEAVHESVQWLIDSGLIK
jgi:nucleoside-diphosphate-sugar epimerase